MGTPPTFTGAVAQTDLLWWQQSRPLAYIYQTVAQASVPSSTWTAVSLDTELVDRDGGHSGTTGQYTVGLTYGWYWVSAVVAFDNTGGTSRGAQIVLNGTPVPGGVISIPMAAPGTVAIPPVLVHSTSSGDYIELQCYQDSGSAINLLVSGGECSALSVEYAGTS